MKKRRWPPLLSSWHLVLLQAAISAALRSTEGSGDASALLQRGLSVGGAKEEEGSGMATEEMLKAVETAISSFGAKFSGELQAYQAEQQSELESVQATHSYLDQLRATFGRRGTLFAEMTGLFPMGKMSEADDKMAAQLLVAFRSQAFVKAVAKGLEGISDVAHSLVWRCEKHVVELVRKSASASREEVVKMLTQYFGKQRFILQNVMDAVEQAVKGMLAAAPGNPSMKAIWADLLNKLFLRTKQNMDKATDEIIESNFEKFCGKDGFEVFIVEQALPILNGTAAGLPRIASFAKEKVPDVAPQVAESVTWLGEIVGGLTGSMNGEARIWFEKVCGLVGAVADTR